MDQQDVLVDEVAPHQRLEKDSTAEYDDILAGMRLQPGHGLRRIALEQRGVDPRQRLFQRRRGDILLGVVEHRGEGIVVGPLGPDAVEVLVRPSPE